MNARVVVTGMGVVNSIANSVPEFGDSLKNGSSGIRHLCEQEIRHKDIRVGAYAKLPTIDDINARLFNLPLTLAGSVRTSLHRAAPPLAATVLAATEAWVEAGLNEGSVERERIGIIVAGSNLTDNYQYSLIDKYRNQPQYLTPRYVTQYMDSSYVSILSQVFAIRGEGFTVGGASASGNVALIKALQLIRLGVVDVCMVLGVMEDLSPLTMQGYSNVGAMAVANTSNPDPGKICCPFDKAHCGFVLGQGSGCLIVENAEIAHKRGVHALAEIAGGVAQLDGNSSTNPSPEGECRVMNSAIKDAGVSLHEVDYINAHGTSTPIGDAVEIEAIKCFLKNRVSEVWVNSTKSLVGHCLYSAGVIEAIATIIQISRKILHPNLNLNNPIDTQCRFVGDTAEPAALAVALSNSFGFGGINTSVVIRGVVI